MRGRDFWLIVRQQWGPDYQIYRKELVQDRYQTRALARKIGESLTAPQHYLIWDIIYSGEYDDDEAAQFLGLVVKYSAETKSV